MSKNAKSGEVIIGVAVGLLVGCIILGVSADKKAQEIADRTGQSVSGLEVIADQPMQSLITIVTPSLAGAGLGYIIDNASSQDDKAGREITVGGDGNIVVIGGDGNGDINIDDSENPVTTTPAPVAP